MNKNSQEFLRGSLWSYGMWFLFAAAGQMSWVMACAFSGFFVALTLTAAGVRQHKLSRAKLSALLEEGGGQPGETGAPKLEPRCYNGEYADGEYRNGVYAPSPAAQVKAVGDQYGLPVAGPPQKEFTKEEEARYRNAQANHGLTERELSDYQAERDAVADAATAVQDYVPKGQEELYALLHRKLRDQVAEMILAHGGGQPAHWEVHPKWMHDVEHVRPGASRISRLYGYPLHVADGYGAPELVPDPEPPPAPPEPEPVPEDPCRQSWNLELKREAPENRTPDWTVIPVTGTRAAREDRYFKDRKDGYRK